jgi:hypothetical protein
VVAVDHAGGEVAAGTRLQAAFFLAPATGGGF